MAIEAAESLSLDSPIHPFVVPYNRSNANKAASRLIYCATHRHQFELLRSPESDDPRFYISTDEEGIKCLQMVGLIVE